MPGRLAQARPTLQRFAVRVVWFGALWLVLVEGELHHPSIALLAIAGAAAMGVRTGIGSGWRLSARGLLRFIPYFVRVSFSGALDVALRAFRRHRALDPELLHHRARIPIDRPAFVFFADVMNLIPGTLCAGIDGREVTIHVIDRGRNPAERVTELEERVAALFGEPLEAARRS
jgi:multicomponent Na+:H+ antiporter subunit E